MYGADWVGGDPTRMQSAAAVVALWERWGDANAVLNAVSTLATWGQLATLSPAERVRIAGPVLASVELPVACPPLVELPGGGRPVTPYDTQYPTRLPGTLWPVLYVSGTLPSEPAVLVTGGNEPTAQAVEIARAAALAAAGDHIPMLATPTPGIGLTALRTCVAAGGRAIAVIPHDLTQPATYAGLLDDIRRSGGAVLTCARPGTGTTPDQLVRSAHLSAALASAAVVAEVGPPPSLAATVIAAVIAAGCRLIVPTPPTHYVPAAALGLSMLATPRAFSPSWYGTNTRIEARVRAGLPAADDVVSDQHQIGTAIAAACTPPPMS